MTWLMGWMEFSLGHVEFERTFSSPQNAVGRLMPAGYSLCSGQINLSTSKLMKTYLFPILLCLMAFVALPASAADKIHVTFTNRSGYEVSYFLNGGKGVNARLANGKTATWKVTVDPGIAPIVRIHQVKGKSLDFTLSNGGQYVFEVQKGKIVNAYK